MMNRKKHLQKGRSVLVLAASLVWLFTAAGSASEPVKETGHTENTEVSGRLPRRYDCRDQGKAPTVRKQGRLGTCWAISACSALEAFLLPDEHLIFSPDHMSMNNGFVITQEEGGDPHMIMAYLSGWLGPVLESEDPYGDGKTADGLSASVHVQEMHLLDGLDADEIKSEILTCGPVQTSLCMDRSMTAAGKGYYNPGEYAFCDPVEEKLTHDILILGWDDDYPGDNFLCPVRSDGAWICQNTWGRSFGENGVFYVSYEDANIAGTGLAYACIEDAGNYDHLYQNDICGWQGRIGYDNETAWFANCYTAREDETLMAAGFYSLGRNTDYELFAVHSFKDSGSFSDMEKVGEGHLNHAGYFTVPLTEDVKLSKGERFALAVHITSKEILKPVAVEMSKDSFTAGVSLEGKEGYVSAEGILWDETETVYGANVCLKVYTCVRAPENND